MRPDHRARTRAPRRMAAGLAAIGALLLGGCGPDLYDVPLPSKVSGPTYELEAEFESALNLPVASPVKLEGRTVGQVTSVSTADYVAHVTMAITEGTELPAGTQAQVRLTAPVGESFVALKPPADPTGAVLADGDRLTLVDTSAAPDTTDLLTGVSTAVTGGSYADLKVVVDELVIAMDGSSSTARHLLREVDRLVTSTNQHRGDIDRSLDALDRLTSELAEDTDTIATSLDELGPAVRTLEQHEDRAVALLASLDRVEAASRSTMEGLRGRLKGQLDDTARLVDAVIEVRDQLRPLMTGVTAFANALDRATPGDFAMFDLTANAIPALRGSALQLPPDAATVLESDPTAVIKGLTDTLTGEGGLLSFLQGLAEGGEGH